MVACHSHQQTRLCSIWSQNMNLNSLENAFFSTNISQICTGHHRKSAGAQTELTAKPAPPCGRRGCSDAVIQWAPASSGRSAASLSQRHFCARQVRTVSHSAPKQKKQGSGNYWRGIWRRRHISFPLFSFLTRDIFIFILQTWALAASFWRAPYLWAHPR